MTNNPLRHINLKSTIQHIKRLGWEKEQCAWAWAYLHCDNEQGCKSAVHRYSRNKRWHHSFEWGCECEVKTKQVFAVRHYSGLYPHAPSSTVCLHTKLLTKTPQDQPEGREKAPDLNLIELKGTISPDPWSAVAMRGLTVWNDVRMGFMSQSTSMYWITEFPTRALDCSHDLPLSTQPSQFFRFNQ